MLFLLCALLMSGAQDARTFTASLVVTNQPGTVFMRWQQRQKFEVSNVENARRGEPVAALILFSGCRPDKDGNCDVRADIAVLDPAGKLYGDSKDTDVWVRRAAPPPGNTELGFGYLMIRIEPKDPPGTYRVKAHITDRNAGAVLDREWAFKVPPLAATDSVVWPADRTKPNLAGFWKDHCDEDFGLKIEAAPGDLYSISFCGPGGCFEPGTYRPNSSIFGDEAYRVVDADTLEVLGHDGFSKYYRCAAPPQK